MRDELSGKRIVILGLARQGKALAAFAVNAGASVVVSDTRDAEQLSAALEELKELSMEMVLGEHPLSLLDQTDVLALSGGVPADLPIVLEAQKRGLVVTNDSLEFMKRCPAPVTGITGSAGKTTTTALTGAMGRASGRRTWIGGNIGRPLLSDLPSIDAGDFVVQELSSFQLEHWRLSPQVAAVLNLTPNHLDRHKSMEAYRLAKANILRYQGQDGIAVLFKDDPGSASLSAKVKGRLRFFSLEEPVDDGAFARRDRLVMRGGGRETEICRRDAIPLRGQHNVLNVLAAIALADSNGIEAAAMEEAIRSFKGVEHRLEAVLTYEGVQFINDSIATAPERAMAALTSFDEPVILLAGGKDKNMVWDQWARIVAGRVKAVVLFGKLAPTLADHLENARRQVGRAFQMVGVETLGEAVPVAARLAEAGDIVLLSPGGTSYDAYNDFVERGVDFRRAVHALARRTGQRQ